MTFAIQPFRTEDLPSVYDICLRTGASGEDASAGYRDGALLGHVYAGPYAMLEPDLCFVLELGGAVCGYVLGTADSQRFSARCEAEWFPALRMRYPMPETGDDSADARMVRLIHAGYHADPDLAAFPAHLHIDLLPTAQGQAWGGMLLDTFLAHLAGKGVRGVHLVTGPRNPRAIRFYERNGFVALKSDGGTIVYGRRLGSPG